MKPDLLTEEELPLIPEDLEIGDRLYCDLFFDPRFGVVQEVLPDRISILMDDGGVIELAPNKYLTLAQRVADWAKPFPMDELKVGIRVSILDDNGKDQKERFYGTVIEYVPDTKVVIAYDEGDEEALILEDEKLGIRLEDKMKYWEFEA